MNSPGKGRDERGHLRRGMGCRGRVGEIVGGGRGGADSISEEEAGGHDGRKREAGRWAGSWWRGERWKWGGREGGEWRREAGRGLETVGGAAARLPLLEPRGGDVEGPGVVAWVLGAATTCVPDVIGEHVLEPVGHGARGCRGGWRRGRRRTGMGEGRRKLGRGGNASRGKEREGEEGTFP